MQGNPIKILLVDDDEDDYIITRGLIAKIGQHRYQLDWVCHYDEALAAVQRNEHDICLLDYRLGERTGLELLMESQALVSRPPMILLTGQGDHEIDIQAMQAGAADYLVKGQLNPDMLERAIRYGIEHRRAEENLRRERDLITRITETSPASIVVTDQTGKIIFANHCAEAVLNLEKHALEDKACNVLDWYVSDPEGHPVKVQPTPLKNLLETGQPVQGAYHVLNLGGDRRVLLSTNATPLYDAAGKIDGMVVTVENITERLALEAQLRQSQKMETVGQLAAGVAHDINNILTVIHGHTGLLLARTNPGSDTARSLSQIAAASERAAGFIRHLLMFSRKQVFQTKVLDLNTVLRNLEYMLPRLLDEHINLETRYHAQLPSICADTGMIEQIVMNLVVNARDAMPKNGTILIETSLVEVTADAPRRNAEARAGSFVCLTVQDTGSGIEAHLLPRIFEPFFTTKETGKGTGLGLATVYGIVKQHRGWIEVESKVGTGTTFRIFMPAVQEKASVAPAVPVSGTDTETYGGNETILLVEDEINLLELTRKVLQRYHFHVLVASCAAEALHIWDEHYGNIDLVLTDMVMPGDMSGADLVAELKKRKPELKVIVTSGYSAELVGKDFGRCDTVFLPKPYQPQQIARVIRNTLDTGRGVVHRQ